MDHILTKETDILIKGGRMCDLEVWGLAMEGRSGEVTTMWPLGARGV